MFNTFLTNILNSYLGEIVEDLDLENIGSGALHGDILLIDLKLRPDCLSVLELPIEVKFGCIGKLSLKIPWTNLASSPVTLNIQDVFIVAVPLNHRPYYARQDERLERTRKRRFLQKLEGISVLKKAAVSHNSKEEKLKRELWETMVATFMNNVQLQIERVHIRYEDATSLPGMVISGGLCLQSLTAETTNSKWKETEINGKASTIFKLVKFSQFSLYCVCGDKVEVGRQNNNNWRLAMRDILETVTQANYNHNEILAPLSGRMKIMMNRSIKDGSPRLLFDYVLKDLHIELSKSQYHAMMAIQSAWKFLELSRVHRKFRPKQLVLERPKLWWKYAFNCIRVHFILPYTWRCIKEHRDKYKALVELWERRWRQGKSSGLKHQLKEAEGRLDVTSIMIAREQAKILARRGEQQRESTPGPSSSTNKFRSFVTGVIAEKKAALVNQPMFSFLSATNIELQLLEICKAMGCSFEPDDSVKPRSYIEHVFNFSLQRCQIRLKSILVCRVVNFNVCIETRPSGLAYTVACRTENLKVETDEGEASPVLTSNNLVHSQETGWPNLFKLVFEKNPLSANTDFKLDIQLLPVQIYYHEEVFSELLDFLFLPQMDVIQVAWGFIYQGYKYGMQFSRFVRNCLTSRVLCDLNIDLQNPCITIGQYGKMSHEGSNFIVDCGRLKVESALVPEINSETKKYDEFEVTVSGVQVVHVPSQIQWSELRDEPSSEYHIVPTTKVKLTLSTSVLATQDIPAWKLDVFVKCAKLNLSDSKLSNIIDFLRDLPLPSRSRNMQKTAAPVKRWKIDKRWIIPNIGKLELLYLENQLSEQETSIESNQKKREVPILQKKPIVNGYSSDDSSANSIATDLDVQAYCREIDLPGFEDNISAGNKMLAVVTVCVKDAGLIFDRASGSCDKSYLYLGASNLTLEVGVMEHGPALQFGVESVKLLDRQAGVELVNIGAEGGSDQASAVSLLYRYISPTCPEFKTLFKSVQHSLVCDIGKVQTVLHKTSLWTLYNAASFIIEKSHISLEDMKPVFKKSKSALKRLKKWKPFRIPKTDEESRQVFLNLSLRLHHFSSLLCDSDQELLNFTLTCLEMDAVFQPKNKLVFRTFISRVQLEDITQFSLFPKVISVEEGDALELKLTINLKPNQQTSGSFAANIGHFNVLVLHRVIRLLQFYVSPLDFVRLLGNMVQAFHWMIGPSLKIFLDKEKFVDLKFKMEGPTFIVPEGRENPQVIAFYLGKIGVENLLTKNGTVQNIMIDLQHGQIYSGFMGINQHMELRRVILEDFSCKVDCKIEIGPKLRQYSSVVTVEEVTISLDNGDILLFSHILHNNLLKLKIDLCSLFDFIPTSVFICEASDLLMAKDVTVQNKMMVERVTVNLENTLEDQAEDRSSSPINDGDTIFQIQIHELDYEFDRDPNNTSTKAFNIGRAEFVDVKANLEEQWLVDNIKGKSFFYYEEKECRDSISRAMGFNVDTLHIYPRTLEKFFSFFVLPANLLECLEDSQQSLQSGSTTSDLDGTTEEEEVSSGYQTSQVRSPQLSQEGKQEKFLLKVQQTNLVYHCSDLYRRNLLIAKLGGKLEADKTGGKVGNYLLYVDLDALDHYDNGLTFHIWNKASLLINCQSQDEKVTGLVNVTPAELHFNRRVCQELRKISNLKESFVDFVDPVWEEPRELWTQRKIKRDGGQSHRTHPLRDIITRTIWSSQRKSLGVNLQLDQTEVRVLFDDQHNQPMIASKLKLSGKFRRQNSLCECEGTASLESIIFNQQINRWEHLLQAKEANGNSVNIQFFAGSLDLTSGASPDVLDDIPFHPEELSIDDLLSGECGDTEDKLQNFLNNHVISDDSDSLTENTEGSPGSSDFTSDSRTSSLTSAGPGTQNKFSSVIQVKDEILVNVTSSVSKTLEHLFSGKTSPIGRRRMGQGGIVNLLGLEADIEYSEIRDGKVEKIMEIPNNIEENSSDDEIPTDDLPWRKSNTSDCSPFSGFEEAGLDTVNELTKVITSNILNIDVPGFQPMKILVPKRSAEKVLSLYSELDHENYQFVLCSTFLGHTQQIQLKSGLCLDNRTSFNLAIYVESDNLHWRKSNPTEQSSNPFASSLKLAEISPGDLYCLPLFLTKDAKLSLKITDPKSSQSDSSFSTALSRYDQTFLSCQSLESTASSHTFRVTVVERQHLKIFQIWPLVRILNNLSVPCYLKTLKDTPFVVQGQSSEDLYDCNSGSWSQFFLEVSGKECSVRPPTGWPRGDTGSVMTCHTTSKELMEDRLLVTAGNGILKIHASLRVDNDTSHEFVIDAGRMGRYRVSGGSTTFMSASESKADVVTSLKIFSPLTRNLQQVSLTGDEDSRVLEMEVAEERKLILLVTKKEGEELCLIKLSPLWAVRNQTRKELLLQETPCVEGGEWRVLESGVKCPVYCQALSPSFVLRDPASACQTDQFQLTTGKPKLTLRLNSVSGLNIQLKTQKHEQNIIEISELTEDFPFTFSNNSTELVVKLKQAGESQCWLLSPGHQLHYTWDNNRVEQPQCLWTVYGGCDQPFHLKYLPGRVLWGEERVVYKTIRKSYNSSTDSESSDSDSEVERRRGSFLSRKKTSVSSPSVPQNIVYKHKKTVFWISDSSTSQRTSVYFLTSRKLAARQLRRLTSSEGGSLQVSIPGLHLSVLDEVGEERLSVASPRLLPQWSLLLNNRWRYLGLELSAAIEVASRRGLPGLSIKDVLKVDLQQQSLTSPVFAPLRRVESPALALEAHFSPAGLSSLTAALAGLELRREGEMELVISKPLLELENVSTETWPTISIQELNIELKSVEISDTNGKGGCLRAPDDDVLDILRRQNISVSSLCLSGFQLVKRGPGDQFYQKLLKTGRVTERSQIASLGLSVWDKSTESTLKMVESLVLTQLWDVRPCPAPRDNDKWTRFWKNILYQRELYIKCRDSGGSVLDSPSFVRPESDVRENSVLHYLLHHLKLTSEDKTNYYSRLLNSNRPEAGHYGRAPSGYLGVRPVSLYTALGHFITRQLGQDLYIHHVGLERLRTVLITDRRCVSLQHNRNKTDFTTEWSIDINKIHNLPVLQDDRIMIHVAKGNTVEPLYISCHNVEKLRSIQLALEYTLLLTMPFTSLKYDRNVC